jgi:hypothetical protein
LSTARFEFAFMAKHTRVELPSPQHEGCRREGAGRV